MKKIIVFFVLAFFSMLFAQDPLITDRPDQTESSITVPKKSIQIETGVLFERDKIHIGFSDANVRQSSFSIATTLLRYGIFDNFELRMASEYLYKKVKLSNFDKTSDGLPGVMLGGKFKLFDENGLIPESAILLELTFPVGNEQLAPDNTETKLLFASSHTISPTLGVGYNIGVEWIDDNNYLYLYSLAMGKSLTNSLSFFIESFGSLSEHNGCPLSVDGGITKLLSPIFQVDFSTGVALNQDASDFFTSIGFSYRFPH